MTNTATTTRIEAEAAIRALRKALGDLEEVAGRAETNTEVGRQVLEAHAALDSAHDVVCDCYKEIIR